MHILLADETNKTQSELVKFFVYGGILFPSTILSKLDEKISEIRINAGYKPVDVLKFDTNSRPEGVSIEEAKKAKQEVIETCKELGVKFIVHVILHDIAKNQPISQKVYWAADYVIGRYHKYISEVSDDGIVVIDNVPEGGQYKYITHKFQVGLETPDKTIELPRIKLFASTCIGASHACSAMDIVLGTFRYVINNPNHDVSIPMMMNLMSLIWHTRKGQDIYAIGKGLIFRPKLNEIEVQKYKDKYEQLIENINELIKEEADAEQDDDDESVPF